MVVAGCTSSWWWEEKSRDSRCVVGMEGDLLVSFLTLWQMSEKNQPTRRKGIFCPTLGGCQGDHSGTIAFCPVVRQLPWPWGYKTKGSVYLMLTRKWKREGRSEAESQCLLPATISSPGLFFHSAHFSKIPSPPNSIRVWNIWAFLGMLIQVMVANKYKEEKKMCAYSLSCFYQNNTWQEWGSLPLEAGLQGLPASVTLYSSTLTPEMLSESPGLGFSFVILLPYPAVPTQMAITLTSLP